MIACGEGSSTSGAAGGVGFPVALDRFGATFRVEARGFTGLAVWYGLDRSGFFGGVAPLISSVMNVAALVGLAGAGEELGEEDVSLCAPHACLSGDGWAGAVNCWTTGRRAGVRLWAPGLDGEPLELGEGEPGVAGNGTAAELGI